MTSDVGNLMDRFMADLTKSSTLRVEDFVRQHAGVEISADDLLELIYTEILVRSDLGEDPELSEYQQRFPQFEKRLHGLFQLRQAISPDGNIDFLGGLADDPASSADSRSLQSIRHKQRNRRARSSDSADLISGASGSPIDRGIVPGDSQGIASEAHTPRWGDSGSTLPSAYASRDELRLPQIPGYSIEAELGRGGMGVVYRARQLGLNRLVALKMILSGVHANQEERDRFRREASAIAKLQHPHIVQIYAIGEIHGLPYFSLEYCEKGALDRTLRGTPQSPREAAQLVKELAEAVQVAHQHGVIHRDLKPGNILLGNDGRAKLTDFGLAKQMDLNSSVETRSGAIIGSPSYMAPEQARGHARHVGPAADVYALGAVLYELLTGRPPFKAAQPLDTIMQVLEREPVSPISLNQVIPVDLNTICLKCLEKKSERRYASAQELVEELGRFLRGEPLLARPVSRVARAVRWCRRNPALAKLWGTLLAGCVVFVISLVLAFFSIKSQRDQAEHAQKREAVARNAAEAGKTEAEAARDLAQKTLKESRRQRERAHFYLESFLKLERFGRELSSKPLRHDFDLKVRPLARTETTSSPANSKEDFPVAALGKFLSTASTTVPDSNPVPVSLQIESEADCYVTVFYALPDDSGRCLKLFPNRVTADNLVKKGTPRTILNEPNLIFHPVEAEGIHSFLYVIATSKPWQPKISHIGDAEDFETFSLPERNELKREIASLLEQADPGREKAIDVSEEILLFNVRQGGFNVQQSGIRRRGFQSRFPIGGNPDSGLPRSGLKIGPRQRSRGWDLDEEDSDTQPRPEKSKTNQKPDTPSAISPAKERISPDEKPKLIPKKSSGDKPNP